MKGGHVVIALRFDGLSLTAILLTIFVMVALFAVPVQAETVYLADQPIYIYSFRDSASMLGVNASYHLLDLTDSVSLNANAVLISDDGLSLGIGAGLSVDNMISELDTVLGWTPRHGLFLGVGINKIL
jgi:hypothetical protein